MQTHCLDCEHFFFTPGQSAPTTQAAAQCPNCNSYRTQPSGIPAEQNDMTHGGPMTAMPDSTHDDMSGNPLQEGILDDGGWKNWNVRDESYASVRRPLSLFEAPEFETTQIIAPPDLYRHGLETEAAKRYTVQIPKGITDNLHAALGNLQAWVENPSDNGQLRPYHDQYWKVIRPSFMKPGSLRIGVADPTMAEIINHVAHTDDLTPLYEYRGHTAHVKTAGPLSVLALPAAEDIAGMLGADFGTGLGGGAAAGADTAGAASGVGGVMKQVLSPLVKGMGVANIADDFLGMGGGGGGGANPASGQINPPSYYSRTGSDEDDAFPNSHDEIPQNQDGDHKEQDDGNQHEWQRDISVNGTGGTDHSPSFDPAGPGMSRFLMLAPLLLQMIEGGEDGSQDPLIQGLDQALEAELPGYKDHGTPEGAQQIMLLLKPKADDKASPEADEPTTADDNAGGGHESRVASIASANDVGEFLPVFEVTPPSLNGFRTSDMMMPPTAMGAPPMGPPPASPLSGPPAMPAGPASGDPTSQGPVTDEQQAWFAQWLEDHGRVEEIPRMIANPQLYAKEFAQARHREVPPQATDDASSPMPPEPAQEEAPPGDTMPVPGMEQQMMSAIQRYAADSVAGPCPDCGSHTTQMLDADGNCSCHGCKHIFKTDGKHFNELGKHAAGRDFDLGSGQTDAESAPVQGVPIADQQHQRDRREEQDSGHTWTDETGNPLAVGQEYEMYSTKYDIPNLVRIEAVKPTSLVVTYISEFGLEHQGELTKQEANIEGTSFRPTDQSDGDVGLDDSLELNDDDHTGYSGEPERTDMSAPSGLVAASVRASGVEREDPKLAWLIDGLPRTAGASYTPMEQRALIDESGTARNGDNLRLDGTHYLQDADEDQFLFGL